MESSKATTQAYADCHGGDLVFSDPYGRSSDIQFRAFIQEMGQTFSLSYDQEEVFGRNDAITSYRNTKRSISLSWNVPSTDLYDAKLNRLKTRVLIRLLYPRYENIRSMRLPIVESRRTQYQMEAVNELSGYEFESSVLKYFKLKRILEFEEQVNQGTTTPPDQAAEKRGSEAIVPSFRHQGYYHTQTMKENPLISIKYANLISSASGAALMGYLDGLTVKPLLDEGYFTECAGEIVNPLTKKKEEVRASTYPKVYSISCNFNVIHEDSLGYDAVGDPMSNIFQY